jgi:hypothetical protein
LITSTEGVPRYRVKRVTRFPSRAKESFGHPTGCKK